MISLIISCQSKSEKVKSQEGQNPEIGLKTLIEDTSSKEFIQTFVDELSTNYSIENGVQNSNRIRLKSEIKNKSNKFIEYQFKSKELITNKYGQKSYQRLNVCILQFKNKLKCDKAKELLMNCFPNDCQKIEFDINKGVKTTPSIYLLSDKEILIMKISCENENDNCISLKDKFKRFAKLNTKILEAEFGGITWTK